MCESNVLFFYFYSLFFFLIINYKNKNLNYCVEVDVCNITTSIQNLLNKLGRILKIYKTYNIKYYAKLCMN